ncbi:MAG: fibronectin type III domain-containing protein, partial [Chloroflexota bacterium]
TLLTANPQDGWISVSWVSGSDGGSPILSFTATANPGGFSCITASVSCQLEGLTNGTAYTVSVTASNAVGTSGASNTLVATPFQLPSAPRAVATSPNLASGVGLSWSAPASTGTGPLTGYRIYRGTDTSGQVAIATVGNVLSYTDTFVTNASTYYYTVAALNQYGESVRSSIAPARRGTAPTAPLGVAASAGGPGVTLTWNAPSSDGGSAVTAFRVYRGTASGGETLLVSVGSGTRSYLDKTVAHKTRYFYRVTATNVLGESVASAEVNVVSR